MVIFPGLIEELQNEDKLRPFSADSGPTCSDPILDDEVHQIDIHKDRLTFLNSAAIR